MFLCVHSLYSLQHFGAEAFIKQNLPPVWKGGRLPLKGGRAGFSGGKEGCGGGWCGTEHLPEGLVVVELGLSVCLFVPSRAGGSGSSSTPWIETGRTGEEGEAFTPVQGRV